MRSVRVELGHDRYFRVRRFLGSKEGSRVSEGFDGFKEDVGGAEKVGKIVRESGISNELGENNTLKSVGRVGRGLVKQEVGIRGL